MKTILSHIQLLFILFAVKSAFSSSEDFAFIKLISGDSIRHHVQVLGSDRLEGRATGSIGEKLASDYLATTLDTYGILPAVNNTYFQTVPLHGSIPLPTSELRLVCEDSTTILDLGDDYLLFKSGEQTFIPQPLPMVFVGYGIVAPEFDYNDYQDLDVTGKIVVYLSGEPASDDDTYFNGNLPTIYSYAEAKERIAISRGAQGSILIPNPNEMPKTWELWRREFAFEDITLPYSVAGHLSIMLNPIKASRLFKASPHSFAHILQQHEGNAIHSFELNAELSFRGVFRERDFVSRNVIGKIAGTDPQRRDEYVIVSAHLDHLGIGPPVRGDSIYNGVVDNALGCAGLLEIARVLNQFHPRRSILILFLTGEEKGLLGSQYYIDNPIVPHYQSTAAINIDGLAIFDRFRDVIPYGAELSSLMNSIQIVSRHLGVQISPFTSEFSRVEAFARSDQVVFARAGIPSMLLMEGMDFENYTTEQAIKLHVDWMTTRYHSPFDDLNQNIDWRAVRQHSQVLLGLIWHLTQTKTVPVWKAGTPYMTARLQSIAEKR